MEIRLFDLINNKVDVRNYMFIHEGKIMINTDHVYDVILDTEKDTLQQQKELFDSREEMFEKAKAWDNYLADVESSAREVTSNEDEVKWHVDYAINEYMEGK